MKLSDVVGAMHTHVFTEIALVIAGMGFLTVLVTTFLRRNREPFARAALLPLADDGSAAATPESSHE
jgi:cbb3-type cytochrome oxidase subunit 3